MRNVNYDSKPAIYEIIDNNLSIYRWDIKEVLSGEDNPLSQWNCDEVLIPASVTKAKITKSVLNLLYLEQEEEKMINNYNACILGIYDDDVDKKNELMSEYVNFLEKRKEIKEKVQIDCEDYGIY